MKVNPLLVTAAVVVVANAFALTHAWLNRTGADAVVTLTQDELMEWSPGNSNSGLAFRLQWNGWELGPEANAWATPRNLELLGFDHSLPADSVDAPEFYRRQAPRRAFAALEVTHLEAAPLRVIDVARDPVALRGRHPNAGTVIILPAVVAIEARTARRGQVDVPGTPARISGRITELPTRIHIPKPFSAELRREKLRDSKVKFGLHLRYGNLLEPWVTGIDFPAPH
ncbi:MAG: hypothetical protein JWN34_4400 [Bryobacterales bacterium]|nr:hypothetical protein [Bryobacterales bacterium]